MASFHINEVIKATRGTVLQSGSILNFQDVSTDTRTIQPGSIFIALIGERFDGHHFLPEAVKKGASCLVVSRKPPKGEVPENVTAVLVKDTKKALEDLAHLHRMRFNIPVVAVTGSNGKTTTKDMIKSILSTKFHVCATQKNFNNEIGLSKTLLSLTAEDDVCVVEMGMRGLGQIKGLCRIAMPTIGVVTNVGTSHIGILGSQENIAKAKGELIESLPPNGIAILNEDDPYVKKMGSLFKGQIIGYGIKGPHTVYGKDIEYDADSTRYVCRCFDEAFKVHLKLLGLHNVYDALAATAAARVLGISTNKIQKALGDFVPADLRQTIRRINGVSVLDDSYNANPLSMEMAFRSLKQMKGNRRYLVLGDMGELGKFSEKLHYETGVRAAEMGFDGMITVGPMSYHTAEGARENGMKQIFSCDTIEEACQKIKEWVNPGDLVLIKGSHSMRMDRIPNLWKESS